MTTKHFASFILLIFCLFFTGCATIIHGSKQQVAIISDPRKARIEIDGIALGQTPYVARLTRGNNHLVKIELEGYLPYEMKLKSKLDGWFFGNIVLGGLIGIVIDVATGSMYRLSPKDVTTQLNSSLAEVKKTREGIYLSVVLKPDSKWDKIGQLEKSVPGK
jgi:PEGA domain